MSRTFKEPDLENALGQVAFCADAEHKVIKAAFWAKMADDPSVMNRESITLAQAVAVTGCSKLRRWWNQPGFREWFVNGEEWKQKLLYIIDVGLDSLLDIFASNDPKTANARVRAFEVACRLAGREPAKTKEVRFVDKAINEMNPAQLQAFLESRGMGQPSQLPAVEPVVVEDEELDDIEEA